MEFIRIFQDNFTPLNERFIFFLPVKGLLGEGFLDIFFLPEAFIIENYFSFRTQNNHGIIFCDFFLPHLFLKFLNY